VQLLEGLKRLCEDAELLVDEAEVEDRFNAIRFNTYGFKVQLLCALELGTVHKAVSHVD
jgi:hypothetical protein